MYRHRTFLKSSVNISLLKLQFQIKMLLKIYKCTSLAQLHYFNPRWGMERKGEVTQTLKRLIILLQLLLSFGIYYNPHILFSEERHLHWFKFVTVMIRKYFSPFGFFSANKALSLLLVVVRGRNVKKDLFSVPLQFSDILRS